MYFTFLCIAWSNILCYHYCILEYTVSSSSCMFLDKKTLLKICLYFGLNSTIFRAAGTRNVLDSEHVDVANNKLKSGFSLYFILFH